MFDLTQIKSYFPSHLQQEEYMLKEYLQYKILRLVFLSTHAKKLCFLWGTALRIWYQSQRFSEDLDFDNFWLDISEFESLSDEIQQWLLLEWLEVETRIVQKWAFHCHIKIPDLLYRYQLSPMKTQKILIQIDTAAQWYAYDPLLVQINKFDTQALIKICSPELLLAQKLYTVFERKRMKGRDFHDIVFLLGKTRCPDRWYIWQTLDIHDPATLKQRLLDKCAGLDFDQLQADVQPFLFQPTNQSVARFVEYIQQIEFGQ